MTMPGGVLPERLARLEDTPRPRRDASGREEGKPALHPLR